MTAQTPLDTDAIQAALDREDYETVITQVRAAIAADPAGAVTDPVIADWIGRRFRNIFITECEADPEARKHSEAPFPLKLVDPRDQREKIAGKMLRIVSDAEIHAEMPPAHAPPLTNTTLLFAPGLLTGLLPNLAFQSVWPQIENRFGLRVLAADSHPMRSTDANVADLENAIERGIGVAPDPEGSLITEADNPTPPGDVLLIGYSKGSPDILSLLVQRPDLAPRIRGIIGWAGAIGGSYLADDIYQQLTSLKLPTSTGDLTKDVTRAVMKLAPITQIRKIDRRIPEYDIVGAIRSLTTTARAEFLAEHRDEIAALGIPMFTFTGSTTAFDVPYFQFRGTMELAQKDLHNDMQLVQAQARFPAEMGTQVAMLWGNHWDLSYDAFPWYTTMGSTKLKDPFARRAAMSSIVQLMAELGLLD